MNAVLPQVEQLLVTYTLFPNVWPKEKTVREDVPWEDLTTRIRAAATYLHKGDCPLISMAEYGDTFDTAHKCLRYEENVRRVYGVELDYDGETVPIAQAAQLLQDANLCAILYTSASHTIDKPRWRAILPLSEPTMPEKRAEYVGRANRVLGGIASRESFTLSQSYYIGRVRGAPYDVCETSGRCIDNASDLLPLYPVRPGANGAAHRDPTTDADLRAAFERGEDRYQAMLKLSSRWAARGMSADDIEQSLLELLGAGSHNGDGIDLRTRARPMADSAVRKYGETRRPAPEVTPPPIEPTDEATFAIEPWGWRDPKSIPPRPWLFGHHYMRGMVSVTAGVGGAGKTSLLMVEALCLATGMNLLGRNEPLEIGPQIVWLHNEDSITELERRMAAICLQYQIDPQPIKDRIYLTSAREHPVTIAKAIDGGRVLVPTEDGDRMERFIKERGIDATFLDPFVSIHRANENDNVMIEQVMRMIMRIADRTHTAIELAHHFRKQNGQEPSADGVRGASAIVGAARSVRLLIGMSPEEAEAFGLEREERLQYVYLQSGKSNMAPSLTLRRWFQLTSVDLDNACVPYAADSVGTLMPWTAPQKAMELTGPEWRAVRLVFRNAVNPLATLRYDIRSSSWAGKAVAEALGLEPADPAVRTKMKALIEGWVKTKRLRVVSIADHRQARKVPVLEWAEKDDEE